MSDIEILTQTCISHYKDPHCCGCWNICSSPKDYYLECNECGEVRSLSPLMDEKLVTTPPKERGSGW